MTELYSAMAILVAVALLLICWPWITRTNNRKSDDQRQWNIYLTQQRLVELEHEQHLQLLTEQARQEAVDEVKIALTAESRQTSKLPAAFTHSGVIYSIAVLVLFMLVIGVYWHSNQLAKLQHWQQATEQFPQLARRAVIQRDPTLTPQNWQDLALGLRTSLNKKPTDPVAWLLLGRVYQTLGQISPAIDAFERAYKLAPNHPGIRVSLSRVLVMSNQPDNLRQAKQLLQTELTTHPDDYDTLALLALTAEQLGDKALALENWTKLQQQVGSKDPMAARIQQRIDSLNGVATATGIKVTISITPALMKHLPSSGTLFVFAKDASGHSPLPAAVVKLPLRSVQWPVTVTLTDDNAMIGKYRLSMLQDVLVTARVSKDGNVQTAPGELQGQQKVHIVQGQIHNQQLQITQELTQ